MAIEAIVEQFSFDMTITRARYSELITAEHDCSCLKDIILQRATENKGITASEIKLLKQLYFTNNE